MTAHMMWIEELQTRFCSVMSSSFMSQHSCLPIDRPLLLLQPFALYNSLSWSREDFQCCEWEMIIGVYVDNRKMEYINHRALGSSFNQRWNECRTDLGHWKWTFPAPSKESILFMKCFKNKENKWHLCFQSIWYPNVNVCVSSGVKSTHLRR